MEQSGYVTRTAGHALGAEKGRQTVCMVDTLIPHSETIDSRVEGEGCKLY